MRRGWRRAAAASIALAVLCLAGAAQSGTRAGSVGITSFPAKITIGQTVTITGFVSGPSGADVTVRLYTLPRCSSGATPVTVLTTGSDGTFTFTDTVTMNPPISYGFIVGLSQDPTRTPNFVDPDSCVTIDSAASPSGKAEGSVTVDGQPFTAGPIAYGSTIDLNADSAIRLGTDTGRFRFYPEAGQPTSFVLRRVPLTGKGKKKFVTVISLVGAVNCTKGKKTQGFRTESGKKPGPKRGLWGNGKGSYRTNGQYSSATVRGTWWLVEDRCGGTLTVVRRGVVQVTDFVKKKTVLVGAGHRYLATPPR